jgi:hypothetical protein
MRVFAKHTSSLYDRRHICLNIIITRALNYLTCCFELSFVIMDVFGINCWVFFYWLIIKNYWYNIKSKKYLKLIVFYKSENKREWIVGYRTPPIFISNIEQEFHKLVTSTLDSIPPNSSWSARKVNRSANFGAHYVAHWAAARFNSSSICKKLHVSLRHI